MLNTQLRKSDLIADLNKFGEGKFLDSIDIINDGISFDEGHGFKDKHIRENKQILGKLHHIFHIQDYKKSSFREELLKHAEPATLISYLKQVEIIPKNTKTLSPSENLTYCKKASNLPWGNNKETEIFVNTFGYESSLIPISKEVHESMIEINPPTMDSKTGKINLELHSSSTYRPLYPYQSKLFFEADEMVEKKFHRFMIMMPTGAGKTRLAMEIISHFLIRGVKNEDEKQVIWLADKEELLEQAIETFKNIFPHLVEKKTKLYRLWGQYSSSSYEKNSIIFANYQTLIKIIKNNPNLLNPNLIICDEAHNVIATTYKPAIQKLSEKGACVIGLTATPVRTINGSQNNELKDFFYWNSQDTRRSFLDIEIDVDKYDNTIDYLQKNQYLSYPNKYEIDTGDLESLISTEMFRLVSKSRDLPAKFLEILAKNNDRNRKIAIKLMEIEKGKRTLYFGTNRYQTQLICTIMILAGKKAVYLDGDSPISYRRDSIEKFKKGEIDIICNCDLFTTGFDDPKIQVIMIGRPTKSIVLHQQMIGRGMRGPKMGGTKEFDLYRIKDNLPSIDLADNQMGNYWS